MVGKLIAFLESCNDEHILRDICRRVSDLAERYAPDTQWYVETMTEMFRVAGDAVAEQVAHNLMRVIAEQEDDVQKSAVEVFIGVLDLPKLPEILLQVMICLLDQNIMCIVASECLKLERIDSLQFLIQELQLLAILITRSRG